MTKIIDFESSMKIPDNTEINYEEEEKICRKRETWKGKTYIDQIYIKNKILFVGYKRFPINNLLRFGWGVIDVDIFIVVNSEEIPIEGNCKSHIIFHLERIEKEIIKILNK